MISFSKTVMWFSNVNFVDDNVIVQCKRLCRPGRFQEPGTWEKLPISEEDLGVSGSPVFCVFHTEQWRPVEICLTLTHLCPDVSEGMREVGTTQTLTRSQFMTCNRLPDAGPASGCPFSQEDLTELLSQSWHTL